MFFLNASLEIYLRYVTVISSVSFGNLKYIHLFIWYIFYTRVLFFESFKCKTNTRLNFKQTKSWSLFNWRQMANCSSKLQRFQKTNREGSLVITTKKFFWNKFKDQWKCPKIKKYDETTRKGLQILCYKKQKLKSSNSNNFSSPPCRTYSKRTCWASLYLINDHNFNWLKNLLFSTFFGAPRIIIYKRNELSSLGCWVNRTTVM